MSSMFWATPAPAPPAPAPETDWSVVILYCFYGYFILMILRGISKDKREKKEKDLLSDVIGLKGIKEELKYYMDFINNKKKYEDWDVKLKGILLAGPPGTGKTLLVKTMAKSLDIPIISVAGSSFIEKYVGVGASRVRDLFKKAKKKKKCIVFIDELDAVGSKRNLEKNSERASTLNQLLVEMDGFEAADGVMIFAATNLIKHLDPALLRSGRFDKKVYFDPPNFAERKSMFELYMEDISLPTNLSHAVLSDRTAGMTGADIANITNQAKINAIQRGQQGVQLLEIDIQIAIDEVMIGREKRERMMSDDERKRVAHHEAGHAIMGYILKDSEPPIKVSIIPRGESALGFSQPKPVNKKLYTRDAILAQISVLLGGRCAEKLIYGDISTGAADDIEKISNYVKLYNTDLIGEKISEDVFTQCKVMVDAIEDFTFSILKKHKKLVVKIAKDLLKNETIVYDRIKELLPNKLESSLVCEYGS